MKRIFDTNNLYPTSQPKTGVKLMIQGILYFLFPRSCLVCNRRLHSMKVCHLCWPQLPRYFYHNRCQRCFTLLNASELRKLFLELSLRSVTSTISHPTTSEALESQDINLFTTQSNASPTPESHQIQLPYTLNC